MGRRVLVRWAHLADATIRKWFNRLISLRHCKPLAQASRDGLVIKLGEKCPNCVCELVNVGQHGSPGRVRSRELLHSVIIAPTDFRPNLDSDQIAVHVATQAEKNGLSILRGAAELEEFKRIVAERLSRATLEKPRALFGIATFTCCDVRRMRARESTEYRKKGERLYYVLDTDLPRLPHHADILATLPRASDQNALKKAWRKERDELIELLGSNIVAPQNFRDGALT
jgi:hypothetical protein